MRDTITRPGQDEAAARAKELHATAQARYRLRRKRGLTPIVVELFGHEIDALIACDVLREADRGKPRAVGKAVERVLDVAIGLLKKGQLRI